MALSPWSQTVRCGSVVFVSLAFALGAAGLAADWPQWGGSDGRNACSAEKGMPETFSPGQKDPKTGAINLESARNVAWSAKLGGGCYGNPVVSKGRVLVGVDDQTLSDDPRFKKPQVGGLVKCFDEPTGKLLWQLVIPPMTGFPKEWHFDFQKLGVCSSPTVEGDRAYIVTPADDVLCIDLKGQADGNDGPFTDEAAFMVKGGGPAVELLPTDGDIVWRYSLTKELKVIPHDVASCSVVVCGEYLYLSTSNGVNHGHDRALAPAAPAFIALDKRDGKLVAIDDEPISEKMFHTQWSSPCIVRTSGRTLIVVGGTDGICYAFEALTAPPADGKLKKVWQYDCNPPDYRLRDGKTINYLHGDKRRKDSPNKNDGAYLGPSEIIATPVLADGRLYVAIGQDPLHGRGKGLLHCIDPSGTGDITKTGCVWTYDGLDRTMANATVADGLVYVPDVAGRVHCVDAKTGKGVWVYEMKAESWGSALAADGKLYVGSQKAFHVLALGREMKELAKINVGSPVYSTPIAANGTLYVASQRQIWACRTAAK